MEIFFEQKVLTIKIAIALQSIITLTKLNTSNSNITSIAANSKAVTITRNIHLQELMISQNCFGVAIGCYNDCLNIIKTVHC